MKIIFLLVQFDKDKLKFVFSAGVFHSPLKKDLVLYLLNSTENMRWVGKRWGRDWLFTEAFKGVSCGKTSLIPVDQNSS